MASSTTPVTGSGDILLLDEHTTHITGANDSHHFCFDRAGRLMTARVGERFYRIGLDSTVLAQRRTHIVPLAADEGWSLFDEVAAHAVRVADSLGQQGVQLSGPLATIAEARSRLAQAAKRDASAYRENRSAFERAYSPVPILPPDCYRSVVVQLTEGCRYNRCSFCTLYRTVPYRVKDEGELDEHIRSVVALLDAGLSLRSSVFIGDANALSATPERVLFALARVRELMPAAARGGVRSFVDAFGARPPDFELLRKHGLRRAYVGLETGSRVVLEQLGKPGSPPQTLQLVQDARAAEVGVGVVVLVGAGGRELAAAHVRETVEVLRGMNLGSDDRVFLSPLITDDDRGRAGTPLDEQQMASQQAQLRSALQGVAPVAAYRLDRWLY